MKLFSEDSLFFFFSFLFLFSILCFDTTKNIVTIKFLKTGTFKDLPFSSDNKVSSSHLADSVLREEFRGNTRDCPVRDTK